MYRWDHDIRPVSTVDRIRYIQNCLLLYQRGGIRALSTAPIWTEYRYLQNKSAAGLGNFDCTRLGWHVSMIRGYVKNRQPVLSHITPYILVMI